MDYAPAFQFSHPKAFELASRVAALAPGDLDHVFFCNSGSEAADTAGREAIWREMLTIFAEQVFTIGTVSGVPQPVVVSNRLRNVPEEGIYSWDPGAHFGIYKPDCFWVDDGAATTN
jgi:hypothetical protein